MVVALVGLALSTLGCSASIADGAPSFDSGTAVIAPAPADAFRNAVLDVELQAPVELAAVRWSAATCLDVRVDGPDGDGADSVLWSLADEILDSSGRPVAGLTGPDASSPSFVLVKTAKLDKARVALHEMGHRLGSVHVEGTLGIMAERSYVGGAFIDAASLAGVCAVRDCGCFVAELEPS